MGEGLTPETQQKIKDLAESDEDVITVTSILSQYQSPKEVLLVLILTFNAELNTTDLTKAIDRLRDKIKSEYSVIKFVIIQPQSVEVIENDFSRDIHLE
jgi:divalent metal cation (Fe/Co/Zn/Cd) transporter